MSRKLTESISTSSVTALQIISFRFVICLICPILFMLVYDSNALLSRAHTISIDGNKMYLASVSNASYHPMQVFFHNDPESPVLLRSLEQDYPNINVVHDMYVVHDTVYASCANQGLYIYKYDSVANHFTQLGSLSTYPEQGYNHSSVLSNDHSKLYMCDARTTGKAVKVIDVTTINNPSYDTLFRSHVGAIAHNPYVKGNLLYIAYYLDGVYVYDISNLAVAPVLAGYFETRILRTEILFLPTHTRDAGLCIPIFQAERCSQATCNMDCFALMFLRLQEYKERIP